MRKTAGLSYNLTRQTQEEMKINSEFILRFNS